MTSLITTDAVVFSACFILAFVLASLVEYWVHRLMHGSPKLKISEKHRNHHRDGTVGCKSREVCQFTVAEDTRLCLVVRVAGCSHSHLLDDVKGTILVMCLMFLVSPVAGAGWLLGALVFAAFSYYAHQLQHDNPTKCFWMKMPVHYVHHKYGMWHHNFGLALDWWDHVFGTYKPVDWLTEEELSQPERGHLTLRWW